MSRQFKVEEIKGPLIILDDVQNVAFEEVVEIELDDGSTRVLVVSLKLKVLVLLFKYLKDFLDFPKTTPIHVY